VKEHEMNKDYSAKQFFKKRDRLPQQFFISASARVAVKKYVVAQQELAESLQEFAKAYEDFVSAYNRACEN
jgi:hypothetical protein